MAALGRGEVAPDSASGVSTDTAAETSEASGLAVSHLSRV